MVGDNDGCKKLSLLVFCVQIRTYFSQLKWKILFCEKKVPIETEAIECPVDLESDIAQCFRWHQPRAKPVKTIWKLETKIFEARERETISCWNFGSFCLVLPRQLGISWKMWGKTKGRHHCMDVNIDNILPRELHPCTWDWHNLDR